MHLIVWLFGLRDERKKMQAMKEKNIWSVQIIDLMLLKSFHHNYDSNSSGGHPGLILDYVNERNKPKDEGM